jgi:hypothetical protein
MIGAPKRPRFDLAAVGGHRQIGDGDVFDLPQSDATSRSYIPPGSPHRRRPAVRAVERQHNSNRR